MCRGRTGFQRFGPGGPGSGPAPGNLFNGGRAAATYLGDQTLDTLALALLIVLAILTPQFIWQCCPGEGQGQGEAPDRAAAALHKAIAARRRRTIDAIRADEAGRARLPPGLSPRAREQALQVQEQGEGEEPGRETEAEAEQQPFVARGASKSD